MSHPHARSFLFAAICVAPSVFAVPTAYENEASFLADLAALPGVEIYTEGFESAPWDQYRYPAAIGSLEVSGVTWSGNAPLATNLNWGRTGYGVFTIYLPPGSPDEFYADSERPMYAFGGHFDSNADFGDVWIEVDGQFGAGVVAHSGFPFAGVIDPDGFTSVRIYDPDQEHVLGADDFTIAIAPACPADLNNDGVLNLDDVNLFASAFVAGGLLADVDGNGLLNLDDVNLFASSFVSGCP